jgi:long-chain acyl-CoA synthetase
VHDQHAGSREQTAEVREHARGRCPWVPVSLRRRVLMETLDVITRTLRGDTDRDAVLAFTREGVTQWSRARLLHAVGGVAAQLAGQGIEAGDRVALYAELRPNWIAAALAALQMRAVLVPLDAQFTGDTLAHVLRDSGARCVLTDAAHTDALPQGVSVLRLDEDIAPVTEPPEAPPAHPDTVAAILYTSGTTGFPKGVPLTHRNLSFQAETLRAIDLVHEGDRVLLPLPAHHVYPFAIGVLAVLALGLPLVIPAGLTGPQIARALRESGATVVIAVPRLYAAVFDALEARIRAVGRPAVAAFHGVLAVSGALRRLIGANVGRTVFARLHRRLAPQLRLVACGGAALDAGLARKLEAFGWALAVGYGLTETSPLLTLDRTPVRPGSVGRAIEGVRLRVQDGEIQARGPGVFEGYLNRPEKTEEVFTADGWFRTGDRGALDADGYLFVQGRISEIIVTAGGVNVQPDEVEAVFTASPFIREAALLPTEKGLALLVVPDTAEALRAERPEEDAAHEAVADASRRLASYQRPAAFALTHDPLPRTRLGKLQRHLLRERYDLARAAGPGAQARPLPPEQWTGADRALLDAEAAQAAWIWLTSRYPDRRLTPDSHMELELGLDSLGWIDLTLELGTRAGVELDDTAIAGIETVRDLLNAAGEAQQAGERGGWLAHPERVLGERERVYLTPLAAPLERLARWLTALNRTLMRRMFRVRAQGIEHLPRQGPYLLVPNHGSLLDPFALAAVFPKGLAREVHWAGISEMAFANAVLRGFSRLAHVLPVDPRRGAVSSLALAAAVLDAGKPLVWFPEGQRSVDGRLLPFKRGIGLVLETRNVPVVPVVIRGANDAMPPGKRLPRRSEITVELGAPVLPDELAHQGKGMRNDERITNGLHARIWAMCEGRDGGHDASE